MTNPHCECPVSGWCKRHQMMKGAERHKRCQGTGGTRDCGLSYWNAWEQGRLGATPPANPVFNPEGFCGKPATIVSQIGTRLSEIIKRETGIEIPCAVCRERIATLDSMTQDQARQARDSIVGDIVERAPEQAQTLWQRLAIGADAVLHTGILKRKIESWYDEAVATGWEPPKKKLTTYRKPRARAVAGGRNQRRPYTGWRGEQDGPRIILGPFESTIRHLTYHVWPTRRSDCWQWNLQQLAKRWRLFNGIKCIGIATDKDTFSSDEVMQYAESLGMVFDHVVSKRNDRKLREVVTWIPMLQHLQPSEADANEVVFSAHAKGTQYENGEYTRNWCDLMYQSCLDYWPVVEMHLRTSLMTGSFREFGLLGKWHDWAYSGTFFWWRLQEIGKRDWRNVDQWFAGTESWTGKMCDPRETQCLFLNNNTRLYVPEYWTDVVWPEWEKWQRKMRYQRGR